MENGRVGGDTLHEEEEMHSAYAKAEICEGAFQNFAFEYTRAFFSRGFKSHLREKICRK